MIMESDVKKAEEKSYIGHRQRLRDKFLADNLADYEALELLLTYAIPRRDIREIARQLYKKYGGVHQIISAPIAELIAFPGLGESSAICLKLVSRFMLTAFRQNMEDRPVYSDPKVLTNYCRMLMLGKTVEELHVLYFDKQMHLLLDDAHSRGTADESAVYIPEIAKQAIKLDARSVLLLHNHPTVGKSFSRDDIKATVQIEQTLKVIGVELYDHFVVSGGIVYSARGLRLLQ